MTVVGIIMTASSKIAKLQSNIRYKIVQSSNHSHIWGVLKNGGSSSHHGCLKWPNGLHDVGTLCLKPPCCWRIDCISQSRNSRSPQSKKALLQRSGSKVHWGILGTQSKPVSQNGQQLTNIDQSQGTAMPKDLPIFILNRPRF